MFASMAVTVAQCRNGHTITITLHVQLDLAYTRFEDLTEIYRVQA
jgi:hypothetical protein